MVLLEGLRIPIDQTLRIVLLIVFKQAWMNAAGMVQKMVKRTGKRLDNYFFGQTICQNMGESCNSQWIKPVKSILRVKDGTASSIRHGTCSVLSGAFLNQGSLFAR